MRVNQRKRGEGDDMDKGGKKTRRERNERKEKQMQEINKKWKDTNEQ